MSTGLDALTEHAACVNCGHPVHSTGSGKTWIHTLTDTYRCPEYPHGWAEPMLEGDIETRIDEACAEAESVGRESGYEEGHSDGESEGRDAGYDDGQKDGIAEGVYKVTDSRKAANSASLALACVLHPVMLANEKADILATRCEDVVALINAALQSPLAK